MSDATVRAVRAGLLILPDEALQGGAQLQGYVLRFNPARTDADASIDAIVAALTPESPRCVAVLLAVVEATQAREATPPAARRARR